MNEYFSVGKFAATFGVAGELVLKHALGKKTDLKGLETLFVEDRKDSFLPYFVDYAKGKTHDETLVKLEGIDSKERAQLLTRKEVWLLQKDFEQFTDAAAPLSLLGYMMINEGEPIGEVLEVIEQPLQVLCKIIYNGNEALIPIHEETLDEIDKENREVHVTLPDGLLDIYA
jgi:16S rRNA processing protein RimM